MYERTYLSEFRSSNSTSLTGMSKRRKPIATAENVIQWHVYASILYCRSESRRRISTCAFIAVIEALFMLCNDRHIRFFHFLTQNKVDLCHVDVVSQRNPKRMRRQWEIEAFQRSTSKQKCFWISKEAKLNRKASVCRRLNGTLRRDDRELYRRNSFLFLFHSITCGFPFSQV